MSADHHKGPLCRNCGQPTATDAAWAEINDGEGGDLCWDSGTCPRQDWPAVAASLREENRRLRAVLEETPENVEALRPHLTSAAGDGAFIVYDGNRDHILRTVLHRLRALSQLPADTEKETSHG